MRNICLRNALGLVCVFARHSNQDGNEGMRKDLSSGGRTNQGDGSRDSIWEVFSTRLIHNNSSHVVVIGWFR